MSVLKETLLFANSSGGGKEYKVVLFAEEQGTYGVDAFFGPAGNLRQKAPQGTGLDLESAMTTYRKAIKKKMGGSGSSVYSQVHEKDHAGTGALDTSSFAPVNPAREVESNYQAQLLTSIDSESDLLDLLRTGQYIIQEKMDGDRMMTECSNGVITFFNRKGQVRHGSHPEIEKAILALETDCFLDGEIVGDTYYLFDVLHLANRNLTREGYRYRLMMLETALYFAQPCLQIVPSVLAEGAVDQMDLLPDDEPIARQFDFFRKIIQQGSEGVVLHLEDGIHQPGRTKEHFKYKVKERSTCIVAAVNQKRSVSLCLMDDGVAIEVGNVSIPANHDIPEKGDLIEVEYLYKFRSGSLFQPVYKGKRTDVSIDECTMSQVRRYKNEAEEVA
jgi:bifunctional non-homologous end joining protein LigD